MATMTMLSPQLNHELNESCRRGDSKLVNLLITKGADVNFKDETYGWTPLHNAAREGHVDMLKMLAHNGAQVTVRDALGQIPLHRAAQRGHKKVVNYLLFLGSDPLAEDDLHQTPADLARGEKHEVIFQILLKAMHKRERELLEERKKADKEAEKRLKKEKKLQEKAEKGKKMTRQRSLSLDGGLEKVNSLLREGHPEKKHASPSRLRLAFSRKDHQSQSQREGGGSHPSSPTRLSPSSPEMGKRGLTKSSSFQTRGDNWIGYINGEVDTLD